MGLSPEAMAKMHEGEPFDPGKALASPEFGKPYSPLAQNGMPADEFESSINQAYAGRPDVVVTRDGAEVQVSYTAVSYSPGTETTGSPMPPMHERSQKITAWFGPYGLSQIEAEDVSGPDALGMRLPTIGVRFEPFHSPNNQTLFTDAKGMTYMLLGRETTYMFKPDGTPEIMTVREMDYMEDNGRYEPVTPSPKTTFHHPDDIRKITLLDPLFPSEKSPPERVAASVAGLQAMEDSGFGGVKIHHEGGYTTAGVQIVRNGETMMYNYVLDGDQRAVFYQGWFAPLMADPGTRSNYAQTQLPSKSLFEFAEQEGGLQVSRRLKIVHEPAQLPTDEVDGKLVYPTTEVTVDEHYVNHRLTLADGSFYDVPDVTRKIWDDQGQIADQNFEVSRDLFQALDSPFASSLQFQQVRDVAGLGDKDTPASKAEGTSFVRVFYRNREAEADLAIHLRVVRQDPADPNSPLICKLDGDQPFELTPREQPIHFVV